MIPRALKDAGGGGDDAFCVWSADALRCDRLLRMGLSWGYSSKHQLACPSNDSNFKRYRIEVQM